MWNRPRPCKQASLNPKQNKAKLPGKLPAVARGCRFLTLSCSFFGILLAGLPPAQAVTDVRERSRHKITVEAQRAELHRKLDALKHDISKGEAAQDNAVTALAASEDAISKANRALRELGLEQQLAQARLLQLAQQQSRIAISVTQQQKRLAALLHDQYVAGNEDRFKLLLSGDNPNRINRELHYLAYLSQAQANMIEALRVSLTAIEGNQTEAENTRLALTQIEQEAQAHKTALEQEKIRHATLLSKLASRLAAQRQEAGALQRDEERLTGLLAQLAKLIEEQKNQQKKAAAEALEKRRLLQPERRSANPAPQRGGGQPGNPNAIDADEAPQPAMNKLPGAGDNPAESPFANLRGKLKLPIQGVLIAKYGSKRSEGPGWKGWFIRAAEGAEIRTVAAGTVIFAEWLRGFGNLIIIDHGDQYMTIYGNNQALFKHAGDTVQSSEVIASAGNSGGNDKSGLYFEMRHQGRAFDPLGWVTFR